MKYSADESNSLFADPYALLEWRTFTFEARNLLDKTYAATVEPLGDARFSGDTDSFNPGNGRAFYGSVSRTWRASARIPLAAPGQTPPDGAMKPTPKKLWTKPAAKAVMIFFECTCYAGAV